MEHRENNARKGRFKAMAAAFAVRDFLAPRGKILEEIDIRPGDVILDFGCGPGGYCLAAADRVGESGRIIALDINPAALAHVQKRAEKRNIEIIETMLSNGGIDLPDQQVNVVFLFDVMHSLKNWNIIVTEIRRVLTSDGVLAVSDHHMEDQDVIDAVTESGRFRYEGITKHAFRFRPILNM
ncbi:MAG: class I SAM-dependent methyltransferase [Deltaproteobacteria bacterium]|nr:class I SAM-dependent methyltransferase [Candidatus Zymogenaceae bacterium]